MYVKLLIVFTATIALIFLAGKYPFVATALYIIALVYFVMFSNGRTDLGGVSIRFPLPFYRAVKAHHYSLVTNRSVLNVILFIPFGYLFPTLSNAYHIHSSVGIVKREQRQVDNVNQLYTRWWITVGAGFICSLVIETGQYFFHFGVFELDDLVKNTIGAAIGWLIWKILNKAIKPQNEERSDADH